MKPRQGLQKNHAKADPLQRIQHPQPEPQAPSEQRTSNAAAQGHIEADVGGGPENLRPAGGAKADGEDGQDPRVSFGKAAQDEERESPDDDEEEEEEEHNSPDGCVLARPEISPVSAVGGREPVVLDKDHDQEPLMNRGGLMLVLTISEPWGIRIIMGTYKNDLPVE